MADEKWGKVQLPCVGEKKFCFKLRVLRNKSEILFVYGAAGMIQNQEDIHHWLSKRYTISRMIRLDMQKYYGACLSKEIYNESLVYPLSQNQQGLINNEGCICSDK
ncbi:hypothetical protein RDI58_022551 [Solanum bulbocastanum]|uniref:Uncharacterized protein n=1 Tax=Solanum bulbocastanum TaxID=147425 RepID=A0AAN8T819_SOLBU